MATLEESVHQALALHRSGKLSEAEPIYISALKQLPDHPDLLHMYGILKHQQGDSVPALDYINRAIKVNPLNAAFHNNLGEVLRLTGQHNRAIEAYRKAIRIDSKYILAYVHMGNTLLEARREKEALAAYRQALEIDPNHAGAMQWLAVTAERMGDNATAVEAFGRLAKLKPDDAETARNHAVLLSRAGRFTEAADEYERAIALDEGHVASCYSLVDCLEKCRAADATAEINGRLERTYRRILAIHPDHVETMVRLGIMLADQNLLDEALNHLRRAAELSPRDPLILHHLAGVLQRVPQMEEAILQYEAALAIDGLLPNIHADYAAALAKLGRLDEALAAAERAIALDAGHGGAWNVKATMLERTGALPLNGEAR